MKKNILVIAFLSVMVVVNGQDIELKSRSLTLKLPTTSFFGDIYSESMGIGLGLEHMIKPSVSVSYELNYIFHTDHNSILREDIDDVNGFKLTTEVRKYFSSKEIPESGFFVNTELKSIFTKSTETLTVITGSFVENEISRFRGVLTANMGVLVYWDKNKESRITLEILGGCGLGYITATSSADVESMSAISDYNTANELYPWLNIDIKIGFVLK